MIFYFTATGNSLYVAKQLDDKRFSIPQELNKTNRHYKDDRIGIVCPLFEFDIPDLVKKFIRGSEFETDYFYIVITYGCHDGAVADRVQKNLKYDGKQAQYITSIKMVDNALLVFDMKKEKEIEHTKKIEEKLVIIKDDIINKKHMIQEALKEESEFSEGYFAQKAVNGPMYVFPLYDVKENCVGCGTCAKVCPMGCIHLENGKPIHDYTNCANCMACIQHCPTKAIQFASTMKEVNSKERYRHSEISLAEIIQANNQIQVIGLNKHTANSNLSRYQGI